MTDRAFTPSTAEMICVVLSEIPMNFESEKMVLERAKEFVRNRSQRKGEGSRLPNESHEIAARVVAGVCRYYMSASECEAEVEEVFRKGQGVKAMMDHLAGTADYLGWLDAVAAVRGKK